MASPLILAQPVSRAVGSGVRALGSALPTVARSVEVPSSLSKSILKDLQQQAESAGSLVFGAGAKYPKELKALGLRPVPGLDYTKTGAQLKSVDRKKALASMESNIEAMLERGGAGGFYPELSSTMASRYNLSPELAATSSGPFSASVSVPKQLRLGERFIENPTIFPGRYPGEGSLTAGPAWRQSLSALASENPAAPQNFSATGQYLKIPSFVDNLAFPQTSMQATIDRHAAQAALGIRPLKEGSPVNLGDPEVYSLVRQAYQNVAAKRGILPSEAQAVTWDAWRQAMLVDPLRDATPMVANVSPSSIFRIGSDAKRRAALERGLRTNLPADPRYRSPEAVNDFLRSAGVIV